MKRYKAAIVGATGTIGQRLVCLLEHHPWFEPSVFLASERSAGKLYPEAVGNKWALSCPIPEYARKMKVFSASDPRNAADSAVVFCAVSLPKEETAALEESYAKCEYVVVSNNSANRLKEDVPMIIPEINPRHLSVVPYQRKRLNTRRGFIAAKCNCSLQSYVPLLTPLLPFGIESVKVATYQAVSGAGKTLSSMPEIQDNLIPYIPGEEEKSEKEPLKIWGRAKNGKIIPALRPIISAQCVRVPVSDGHLAAVFVKFSHPPTEEEILSRWENFPSPLLPSSPSRMISVCRDPFRPQPKLDRDAERGMAISAGRLRRDGEDGFKFVSLSHNTLRGAAGGSVQLAELLYSRGLLE